MPVANPSAKTPIIFTQADTEDLAEEIREVRHMRCPLDRTKRLQAFHSLKSFAIEWDIKFQEVQLFKYEESIQVFEEIKGQILKKMHNELKERSERDAANMKSFMSGFSFEEEMFGESEVKKGSKKSDKKL